MGMGMARGAGGALALARRGAWRAGAIPSAPLPCVAFCGVALVEICKKPNEIIILPRGGRIYPQLRLSIGTCCNYERFATGYDLLSTLLIEIRWDGAPIGLRGEESWVERFLKIGVAGRIWRE